MNTENPAAGELLTPKQVCEEFQLGYSTLANHRTYGTGPAYVKLGSGRFAPVRYRRSDIEAWLEFKAPVPA